MRRAWMLSALGLLVPLSVFAHPGTLDSNSCHFCTVDCELYGLTYGDYVCHIANDRTLNLSYDQFKTYQRHFKLLTIPKLREVARLIRRRDEIRNKISAPDPSCRPTIDETGAQKAPLLKKYTNLKAFGELLTALACKNALETVPMLDEHGNLSGGIEVTLKRMPSALTRNRLITAGFECTNEDDLIPCTKWLQNDQLIPAKSLTRLIGIASQLQEVTCKGCAKASSPDNMQLDDARIAMAAVELTPEVWSSSRCAYINGFCIFLPQEWILTGENNEKGEAFFTVADRQLTVPALSMTVIMHSAADDSYTDAQVVEDGEMIDVIRVLNDSSYIKLHTHVSLRAVAEYLAATGISADTTSAEQ